jgi:2-polyprenyl-3-methyl-5-hydroxy-6-metoxy-1,4-benzoquinol methylase
MGKKVVLQDKPWRAIKSIAVLCTEGSERMTGPIENAPHKPDVEDRLGEILRGFEYSEDFRAMIVHHLRGKERWPNYQTYLKGGLGSREGRVVRFAAETCPEIRYHCGDVSQLRALDFGCGTGCSTVVLASCFKEVTGFDIDQEGLELARRRLKEHGLSQKTRLFAASDVDKMKDELGTFDFILANGVIEHIPLTQKGERERTLRLLFGMLNRGGYLYINDTPNRLWPKDTHSTQLWWISWMRPGSSRAYKRAVKKGRHSDAPSISKGPRGLEEVGAWGATYWEIRSCLRGEHFTCLNIQKGHDRHALYASSGSRKLRILDGVMYYPAVKLARAPIVAFTPFINNLVIQKQ